MRTIIYISTNLMKNNFEKRSKIATVIAKNVKYIIILNCSLIRNICHTNFNKIYTLMFITVHKNIFHIFIPSYFFNKNFPNLRPNDLKLPNVLKLYVLNLHKTFHIISSRTFCFISKKARRLLTF